MTTEAHAAAIDVVIRDVRWLWLHHQHYFNVGGGILLLNQWLAVAARAAVVALVLYNHKLYSIFCQHQGFGKSLVT